MNKAQRTIFQVASFMIAFAFLGSVIDYVGAAPDIEDLKIEINKRSEKIQELEAQIRETKNTIGDLQKSERTLANEIARLDAQIKALYLDIALTEEQIGSLNLELERISLEIKQLEDKLYETKKIYFAAHFLLTYFSDEHSYVCFYFQSAYCTLFASSVPVK